MLNKNSDVFEVVLQSHEMPELSILQCIQLWWGAAWKLESLNELKMVDEAVLQTSCEFFKVLWNKLKKLF